jgi:CO dehydrogenase nickel-insertion accessory protein CooC1
VLVETARRIFRSAAVRGVSFVLNKVRGEETEELLRERLQGSGVEPLGTIHDDPTIATAWLQGDRLDDRKSEEEVRQIVVRLERAIAATAEKADRAS